jgi:hypothetical protein
MTKKSSNKPRKPRTLSGKISNGERTYAITVNNISIIRIRYVHARL